MYEKKSYKIMVAFNIMTDLDTNFKSWFDSSEDMYNFLNREVDQFDKLDNGSESWYDKFQEFLINKTYYNMYKTHWNLYI